MAVHASRANGKNYGLKTIHRKMTSSIVILKKRKQMIKIPNK